MLVALFGLLLFSGCRDSKPASLSNKLVTLDPVEVISIAEPPFSSGIIVSWALIGVRKSNGNEVDLYALYGSQNQAFPALGQKCSAAVSESKIIGHTKYGSIDKNSKFLVVYEMKCNTDTFRYLTEKGMLGFQKKKEEVQEHSTPE